MAEGDISVYGAFRAQTGENKVAYASQIYDEAQGKFQSQINEETANDGLVSAKVAQTFTDAEKEQARDNIGAASQEDTYTKTEVDSRVIYDISAAHNNTKYADLAAALGANGANVPEGIRRGGMSVKFVQSSDNKYVQYRLMSDSFNTTVANWQGVDDEPTAGSENLVKSGGVGKSFDEDRKRLNILEESERPDLNRKYNDVFYVTDSNGNVIAKIFANGIQAVEFITKNGSTLTSILNTKVNIVEGKELSTNDYTNDDKGTINMLNSLSEGLYIVDGNNNVMLRVDNNGLDTALLGNNLKNIIKNLLGYNNDPRYSDSFYISDPSGNVIFSASKQGINYIGKNSSDGNNAIIDDGYKQSDIVYNLYYGRSLSFHGTCSSTDSRFTNLMFDLSEYGSPASMLNNITDDIIDNQTEMDALFRGFCPALASNNIILANRAFTMFLNKENGISEEWEDESNLEPKYQYQFLGCNPGRVTDWSGLADSNGLPYKRLIASVRYAKQFADAMGKTFSVGTICWAQAEDTNGSSPKTRYDCIWVAASKLNRDIKLITGQSDDIWFLTYQVASGQGESGAYNHNSFADLQMWLDTGLAPEGYELDPIAASQLPSGYELINRDRIQMGPIMCALSYRAVTQGGDDHVHATEKSYHAMAAQYGLQMKRCMYDQNPIKPIHVVSHSISYWENGKYIIRLKMHVPVKPLVFDISGGEVYSDRALGVAGNYGFTLPNNSDVDIIESVEIVRGEEIKIITNANPSGLTLYYARDGWEHGGNLRDSQNIIYNDSALGDYYMYNWCPIFKIVFE